ncbi:MAG: hypothetical protein GWP25_07115 [Euryarchaeota archaeon]|nr:hypothetical protein [Euryarchaeota archaeon]
MEMNMKENMNELGGSFLIAWAMFAGVLGSSSFTAMDGAVGMGIILAITWMAFNGAHLLPVVTWSHMMTGDLSDTEGNWMANGMRLVMQAIGALLAIILATEAGGIETGWAATEMWIPEIADNLWVVLGMIAAGAVWWQVHTRCESEWASAFGLMALAGAMTITGANEMGASLASAGDGILDTLVNWICDGLFVGIGALVGVKIDEMISGEAEDASAE